MSGKLNWPKAGKEKAMSRFGHEMAPPEVYRPPKKKRERPITEPRDSDPKEAYAREAYDALVADQQPASPPTAAIKAEIDQVGSLIDWVLLILKLKPRYTNHVARIAPRSEVLTKAPRSNKKSSRAGGSNRNDKAARAQKATAQRSTRRTNVWRADDEDKATKLEKTRRLIQQESMNLNNLQTTLKNCEALFEKTKLRLHKLESSFLRTQVEKTKSRLQKLESGLRRIQRE